MKLLLIGDPHLKITRFDLTTQFITWINHVVETTKPDLVVNLGDTFDTHAVVRSEIMSEFMRHVDRCRSVAPYVYLLGNHDMFKPNDSKYHALSHLVGRIDNFTIVDQVQELYGMTFVPYQFDIKNFPKETKEICIAHQTFKGADYGDITTKDGVDAGDIVGAQIIYSGHIHKRHRLDGRGASVVYVGSPFSQSSSDIDQIKGVTLVDTETYKETFIECPLPVWRGLRYELTQNYDIDEMHQDITYQLNDKDHWIVEITGSKAEVLGYTGSKRGKSITTGRDVKIKTIFTDNERKQVRIEALSLDHIISEYIDKVYSGSIEKNIVKDHALNVLAKTRSRLSLVK
jgi:DNA repair exonuclease SbcCD nuclease subunit